MLVSSNISHFYAIPEKFRVDNLLHYSPHHSILTKDKTREHGRINRWIHPKIIIIILIIDRQRKTHRETEVNKENFFSCVEKSLNKEIHNICSEVKINFVFIFKEIKKTA